MRTELTPALTPPLMARRATTVSLLLAGLALAACTTPPAPSGSAAAAPDDGEAGLPEPPAGFRSLPEGGLHGRLESFEYNSTITGTRRRAQVYLPPGYSATQPTSQRYPVLYLLHGIGGNDHEWTGYIQAHAIVDRLITAGQAQPMIIVMPNGRALADDAPGANPFSPEKVAGFARFEQELLAQLMPAVQARYAARSDRLGRALAGLSMGGGQALNFGLGHLDSFAWVGGFSAAPNTRATDQLVPDAAAARAQLALLYLSCGRQEGLLRPLQQLHRQLQAAGLPHVWNVDAHGHDDKSWAGNLYHFAQRLFR